MAQKQTTSPAPSGITAFGTPAPGYYPLNSRIAVSNGTPGGGFLVFPGGQFQPDKGSNVTISCPGSNGAVTGPGNFRPSSFGLTYVDSARVWVPVPRTSRMNRLGRS